MEIHCGSNHKQERLTMTCLSETVAATAVQWNIMLTSQITTQQSSNFHPIHSHISEIVIKDNHNKFTTKQIQIPIFSNSEIMTSLWTILYLARQIPHNILCTPVAAKTPPTLILLTVRIDPHLFVRHARTVWIDTASIPTACRTFLKSYNTNTTFWHSSNKCSM